MDGSDRSKIEQFKDHLRQNRRLKDGVDYAVVHKYGKTYVLSHDVLWNEDIDEASDVVGLPIEHIFYVQ